METGTIVKLSQAGLDWIYPVHDWRWERAKKMRFKFRFIDKEGSARVKRLTSDSYLSFHPTFIEPAK